jgi:ribose-phosphate pyrophosphokinase
MSATLTVFAGTANPDLAARIIESLRIRLGSCAIVSFPDGELQVELNERVRGHDVYLIQSTSPPADTHLVELALLADACRRSGAARITALVPYFGYARQDRRTNVGQALGARVLADMLQATPIERLVVVDLHNAALEGFFSIAVEHLSALPLLVDAVRPLVEPQSVVVAPDLGAVKLAERYARLLELPLAIVRKTRVSGQEVNVRQVLGDVRDRALVIVDDMLSTGGTVAASIEALLAAGCKPHAVGVVSHGLFVGRAEEALLPLPLERILTTDSVAQRSSRLPIDVCSLGPLLAEAIRRLHDDESLVDLYVTGALRRP